MFEDDLVCFVALLLALNSSNASSDSGLESGSKNGVAAVVMYEGQMHQRWLFVAE